MTDQAPPPDERDSNVIPFPVQFIPDTSPDDEMPAMQSVESLYDSRRCMHRQTVFDKRARTVTCTKCGVNVDPFEALDDVIKWIRLNEHRYDEMQRQDRVGRLASDVHLLRVKQGKNSLLVGNCYVSGYCVRPNAIPTEAIALGDYVSSNRMYRVRREGEAWTVMFYDPAHGLKAIPHASKATLAQAKAGIRKHWLWLNNNAKAAGLAR